MADETETSCECPEHFVLVPGVGMGGTHQVVEIEVHEDGSFDVLVLCNPLGEAPR